MRTTHFACAHWTIALVLLDILCCCGGAPSGGLPSQVSRFPGDLKNPKLQASGIYDDGWIAETASVNLQRPAGEQAIALRGMVPKIVNADFTTEVVMAVNSQEVARRTVGAGDFQLAGVVTGVPGPRRVTVTFSKAQELPGTDERMVGAHATFIGFVSANSVAATTSHDIVHGAGLQLGSGWGPLETYHAETFRWVENDAQILITREQQGEMALLLTVEPGPGVGGRCLVKVIDSAGQQVAAAPIDGRLSVKLFVPVEAGTSAFRLHVDGGGRKVQNDQRVLNFRVFDAQVEPWNQRGK